MAAAYVLVAVDAARIAGRPRTRFLARGRVFLLCVGFWIACLPLQLAWEWWGRRALPQSYYVPSGAMLPTLLIGDHLFADPRSYRSAPPALGDIVVFRLARTSSGGIAPFDQNPDLPLESFIKRIVGIPGDSIRFEGTVLFVNGDPKTGEPGPETSTGPQGESLRVRPSPSMATTTWFGIGSRGTSHSKPSWCRPIATSLRGITATTSNDSRYWGTVSRADIVGRATKMYWSWENEESWLRMLNPAVVWNLVRTKTRWDRIGRSIE